MTLSTMCVLAEIDCWVCGTPFAMSQSLYNNLKAKGGSFYCPRGCHLGTGKGEIQDLKDQLAREKQRAEQEEARLKRGIEWRDKDIIARKGQLTKLKNRIANGVCPCCNRSFVNMQRHMKTKHPDYKDED